MISFENIIIIGKMKSLLTFTLFLIFSEISAQQNFITAGQTEEMIVTSFFPYQQIITAQGHSHHNYSGIENIDVNHDGTFDFTLSYRTSGGLGGSVSRYVLSALNNNFILTTQDSFHFTVRNIPYTEEDTILHTVAKKHLEGDTLFLSNDTLWKTGSISIYNSYFYGGAFTKVLTHHLYPVNGPYYYFYKVITGTDTLLGYLHFSTQNKIFSYACQGNTKLISPSSPEFVKVYPNPFTSILNFKSNIVFDFELINSLGKTVLAGKTYEKFNTDFLSKGVYILHLKNEDYYEVKKLMKN